MGKRNPVAKYATTYNKSRVFIDRKKDLRKGVPVKHKGRPFDLYRIISLFIR